MCAVIIFLIFYTRKNLLSNPKQQKWRNKRLTSASAPCPSLGTTIYSPTFISDRFQGCLLRFQSYHRWNCGDLIQKPEMNGGLCSSNPRPQPRRHLKPALVFNVSRQTRIYGLTSSALLLSTSAFSEKSVKPFMALPTFLVWEAIDRFGFV